MANYFPSRAQMPHKKIFTGVDIHTLCGEKLMIAVVDIAPHGVVDLHQHPHEQMGMVLAGKALFTIGGVEKLLETGDCYHMPSNVPHQVINLEELTRAIDVFSPPREEYR